MTSGNLSAQVIPPNTGESEEPDIRVGSEYSLLPIAGYTSDLGLFGGGLIQRIGYGNNIRPFLSNLIADFTISTKGNIDFDLYYEHTRTLGSDVRSLIEFTGQKIRQGYYFGIGNRDKYGWGGRRTDGTGGWSLRAGVRDRPAFNDLLSVEFYVYHMDMGNWDSVYNWQADENGAVMHRGEWTEIENYVKVNTPGKSDGIIRGWVNGKLAFEKEDLRFRAEGYDQYDIQEIMWHIYHGGSPVSPIDQHVYFRNQEIFV